MDSGQYYDWFKLNRLDLGIIAKFRMVHLLNKDSFPTGRVQFRPKDQQATSEGDYGSVRVTGPLLNLSRKMFGKSYIKSPTSEGRPHKVKKRGSFSERPTEMLE